MCRGTSANFKWHWCWIIQNERNKNFIFTTNTMDLKDFFLFEHVNLCIFRLASKRLQNGLLCHASYNSDLKLDTISFPVRVCHFFWDLFRSRVSNLTFFDSCDGYIQVKVSLSEKLFTNSVIHAARQKHTSLRASSMQWRSYRAIHLTIAHIWRKHIFRRFHYRQEQNVARTFQEPCQVWERPTNFPIERFRICPFLFCWSHLTTKPPELHVLSCECQLLAGKLPFHHGETIPNFLLDATVGKIQRQEVFAVVLTVVMILFMQHATIRTEFRTQTIDFSETTNHGRRIGTRYFEAKK